MNEDRMVGLVNNVPYISWLRCGWGSNLIPAANLNLIPRPPSKNKEPPLVYLSRLRLS